MTKIVQKLTLVKPHTRPSKLIKDIEFGSIYLNKIVSCKSCPSLSKAAVPSTLTALIFSRNDLETADWPCRSFKISRIFGCRKNATTYR